MKRSRDDGDDEPDDTADPAEHGFEVTSARPRSLADAWERLSQHNARLETRLEALEKAETDLLEVMRELLETNQRQLDSLNYIGKFHEASEKRGRKMETAFDGVPDVLRTLPSATREQAEKLSEIAARLYEKAQDNTVNALKSAQANHQRQIEDLIDKSLDASRRLTWWAMGLTALALATVAFVWFTNNSAG